jgi:sugar/nucleoside kinase (ribokinase family)
LQALRKDCNIAVVTRGAQGSVVAHGEDVVVAPAVAIPKVVDVTGAGDLYASGFLFGFTQGFDNAKSAQLGSLAAAEVISHVGARPEVNLRKHAEQAGLL